MIPEMAVTLKIRATPPQPVKMLRPEAVQGLQPAAERQREQQGDVDGQRQPAEADTRDAIIGGFLMRGERDAASEIFRHRVPVRADVRDLPDAEPQAQARHQQQGAKKNP